MTIDKNYKNWISGKAEPDFALDENISENNFFLHDLFDEPNDEFWSSYQIEKANPYHDESGRFTSADRAVAPKGKRPKMKRGGSKKKEEEKPDLTRRVKKPLYYRLSGTSDGIIGDLGAVTAVNAGVITQEELNQINSDLEAVNRTDYEYVHKKIVAKSIANGLLENMSPQEIADAINQLGSAETDANIRPMNFLPQDAEAFAHRIRTPWSNRRALDKEQAEKILENPELVGVIADSRSIGVFVEAVANRFYNDVDVSFSIRDLVASKKIPDSGNVAEQSSRQLGKDQSLVLDSVTKQIQIARTTTDDTMTKEESVAQARAALSTIAKVSGMTGRQAFKEITGKSVEEFSAKYHPSIRAEVEVQLIKLLSQRIMSVANVTSDYFAQGISARLMSIARDKGESTAKLGKQQKLLESVTRAGFSILRIDDRGSEQSERQYFIVPNTTYADGTSEPAAIAGVTTTKMSKKVVSPAEAVADVGVKSPIDAENLASAIIGEWARSSGGRISVAMSKTVEEVLGTGGSFVGKDQSGLDFYKKMPAALKKTLAISAKTIYNNTQKIFDYKGLDGLVVFRGTRASFYSEAVETRPISSWTIEPVTAQDFMGTGGVVVAEAVPRERIFSVPTTGPGCTGEAEIVVLAPPSGTKRKTAIQRDVDKPYWEDRLAEKVSGADTGTVDSENPRIQQTRVTFNKSQFINLDEDYGGDWPKRTFDLQVETAEEYAKLFGLETPSDIQAHINGAVGTPYWYGVPLEIKTGLVRIARGKQ